MSTKQIELTSEAYWSRIWDRTVPGSIGVWEADPAVRQQSRLIGSLIEQARIVTGSSRVLEIGCANSLWLPHLARNYGVEVYGVDYSVRGCLQAKHQLKRQGVTGHILCQDAFALAEAAKDQFDVIISFGFVEHFTDIISPLNSMLQMLRPGGMIFATIPNLRGIYGVVQGLISADVLNGHHILRAHELGVSATEAGLVNVDVGYIGGAIYGSVLNLQTSRSPIAHTLMSALCRMVRAMDIVIGRSLETLHLNRSNRWASPYAYLVGQKALRA